VESPADFLERWRYAGLFAVIFAEEAGLPLPVPGDLFIAAMGFLAHTGAAAFPETAATVTTATVLGASVLYLLSRHAGRPLLLRVARRFGSSSEREARLEAWLRRRGALAVVAGRLVPGLRIVMTVVAGALRLPHATFIAGTMLAGAIWSTVYFSLGYAVGTGYARVAGEVPPAALGPAGAVAVALGALAFGLRARRRRVAAARGAAARTTGGAGS
jgi:membrane protein DedA with SNARE-associated domain